MGRPPGGGHRWSDRGGPGREAAWDLIPTTTKPTPERDLKGSRPINYMSPNYSNTIVYKIKCKDPEVPDFYLGYSTFTLEHVARMFEVRCKHDENWPVCEFVRQNGGFHNWCFERLPIGPCSSALEARTELRKHFNADPPTLNKQLPTRTNKEYASGEKNKEAQKNYRLTHLDKIHEDQRNHYQKNRETLLKNRRAYLEANREKINKRARDGRAIKKEAREAEAAAAAATS